MKLEPNYNPEHKETVVTALQVMLENLQAHFRSTEEIAFLIESEEDYMRLFKEMDPQPSPEEIKNRLEESKEESLRELQHISIRIRALRQLKGIMETAKTAPPEVLKIIYAAICNSLLREVMIFSHVYPRVQIFAAGITTLASEVEIAEVRRIEQTFQAYTDALIFGFGVSLTEWNEFPFDGA